MFEIFFALLLLPFELVGILRRARMTNDQRANELAIASQGAGFVALAVLIVCMAGAQNFARYMQAAPAAFPADWMGWIPALAYLGLVLFGLHEFSTGLNRSRGWAGFNDTRLMRAAFVKIALGAALAYLIWNPPLGLPHDLLVWIMAARLWFWSRACILALVTWCCVTGLVKLALVMWRRVSRARDEVAGDIAGQEWDWDEV